MTVLEAAKDLLGYRPAHGFDEFLAALRAGDRAYCPVAGVPQWGIEE